MKVLVSVMGETLPKDYLQSAKGKEFKISDYDLYFFFRNQADRQEYQKSNNRTFTSFEEAAIIKARDRLNTTVRTLAKEMISLMPLCDDATSSQERSKKRVAMSPEDIKADNEEKLAKVAKRKNENENITPIIAIPVPDGVTAHALDNDDEDEADYITNLKDSCHACIQKFLQQVFLCSCMKASYTRHQRD